MSIYVMEWFSFSSISCYKPEKCLDKLKGKAGIGCAIYDRQDLRGRGWKTSLLIRV